MGLRERQEELVRALVAGGADPDGCTNMEAARRQLMRKRAGEVGQAWPMLRAGFGSGWFEAFSAWAANRPPLGSYRDGLEFASTLSLTGAALAEYEQRTAILGTPSGDRLRRSSRAGAPPRKRWWGRRSR